MASGGDESVLCVHKINEQGAQNMCGSTGSPFIIRLNLWNKSIASVRIGSKVLYGIDIEVCEWDVLHYTAIIIIHIHLSPRHHHKMSLIIVGNSMWSRLAREYFEILYNIYSGRFGTDMLSSREFDRKRMPKERRAFWHRCFNC